MDDHKIFDPNKVFKPDKQEKQKAPVPRIHLEGGASGGSIGVPTMQGIDRGVDQKKKE